MKSDAIKGNSSMHIHDEDNDQMTVDRMTPEQRYEQGRSLREQTPLESHAEWSPGTDRDDPIALIEGQNVDRIPPLVPVRRQRMSASPFTFYRGSAVIMAADLSRTPVSGLQTQISGDAHLANFGAYASPERRLVFDLNDFEETLPGPWEWDVKRLAASFIIAGRHNGLNDKDSRKIARRAVRDYRRAMNDLARMRPIDIWYSMVEADEMFDEAETQYEEKMIAKAISKAKTKDSRHVLDRLAEEVDGRFRIRSDLPLIVPLRDMEDKAGQNDMRDFVLESFTEYKQNISDHMSHFLQQYQPVDFALKVVGVGSVGTRCWILMLEGLNHKDPFFLQIKEANKSVLEEYLPHSQYRNAGQRVVEGQRLMQTVSDSFLGWSRNQTRGHNYYWRQLKDWKFSADVENASRSQLMHHAELRGWTLARAHARSGDPIAISGYLGTEKTFDHAIVEFSERYADTNEQDYTAFLAEIEDGRLDACELD